jgi:LmbE family N-acetylglucosaminyl deacetylase
MRLFFVAFVLLPVLLTAQTPNRSNSAAIKLKLNKLNFLGSVLYVAAHPDDENTRIITAMANGKLAATAYLSMTRGDGGQNLIGSEIRDLLGLIRTQELLAARRLDGGQQFFTRANDFGYSKSADETLRIWGKDSILYDVVKVFREFQPDVIITRFPPDERAGHGHHTSSAMLAIEAFDKAADPNVYPEQLKHAKIWQSKRLYTNTGRWWNTSINENTPGIVTIDVGEFSPLLGESFSELAAVSRSQHKSQGFGSKGTRGKQLEFLEYQKGEKSQKDLFEGVNTTWTRVKGGEQIQPLVLTLIKNYDEQNPTASIPALFALRKKLSTLDDSVWKSRKLQEVEQLIQDCSGLFLEVTSDKYWVAPGEGVQLNFELVNRSSHPFNIERIDIKKTSFDTTFTLELKKEVPVLFKTIKTIDPTTGYSDPYWLKDAHSLGLFTVKEKDMIGKPENDPAIRIRFTLHSGAEVLEITKPVIYKWTDPVKGELSRPFEVVPPLFINLGDEVMVFKDTTSRMLQVVLKSSSQNAINGNLKVELPNGWRSEPASVLFNLPNTGSEQSFAIKVIPGVKEINGKLSVKAQVGGREFNQSLQLINYDHIPIQTLLPAAEVKLVRVDLKPGATRVAYLKGAGDEVPAALRTMGLDVIELKNENVTSESLKTIDAVVLGIRALNTNDRIGFLMPVLLEYVKNGGTMIVQYNTNFDLETDNYSPFPLKISRDRVSEEDAEVRILKPAHKVLNFPNKITVADFDHWVQERGLYYPDQWDPAFEAILSMNDKKETPKDGGLLIAKYGNGYYVYTGLSFFRELPEGVSGAYKLFANLVSLSKEQKLPPASPLGKTDRRKKHTSN